MDNKTIIISCAGMGSRLGMGMPKAMVSINGKPLIIHQLELCADCSDVRIVVGYQAEKIIEIVTKYRKDITFCFNYDYKTTGTGASFSKGLIGARDWVVAFDGDLLVHPEDYKKILSINYECVGGSMSTTDNPVLMSINSDNMVTGFSREYGELEWTGLAVLKKERLVPENGHVYHMIEKLLPIKVMNIRTREIDTINDYENAVSWVKNGYKDQKEE